MPKVNCKECKIEFIARQADLNRGWGKFCSKSCKAKEQEKRTGQNKKYLSHNASIKCNPVINDFMLQEYYYETAMDSQEAGWDGHK